MKGDGAGGGGVYVGVCVLCVCVQVRGVWLSQRLIPSPPALFILDVRPFRSQALSFRPLMEEGGREHLCQAACEWSRAPSGDDHVDCRRWKGVRLKKQV